MQSTISTTNTNASGMNYTLRPFDATQLESVAGLDHKRCVFVNMDSSERPYSALLRYLIVDENDQGAAAIEALKQKTESDVQREKARKGVKSLRSIELSKVNACANPFDEDDEDDDCCGGGGNKKKKLPSYLPSLGLGTFETEYLDRRVVVLHQLCGEPVGTGCGVEIKQSLVLLTPLKTDSTDDEAAAREVLVRLCSDAVEWDEQSTEHTYRIHQWSHEQQYWLSVATRAVRPLDSVILPQAIKTKLMNDVDSFSSREARRWYYRHGISYKRSYLFAGPPGVGKSSFLRVLAGHLKRNLALLHPVDPRMTDNTLLACMQRAPDNSIIVLEDVDALFDKKRKSKLEGGCPLTFSGLLNALDGVGNKDGQIFVLTTNHPERLDAALVRPGRVDMRVDFPAATLEQVAGLFLHFYPGEDKLAKQFVSEVEAKLELTRQARRLALELAQKKKKLLQQQQQKRAVEEPKKKDKAIVIDGPAALFDSKTKAGQQEEKEDKPQVGDDTVDVEDREDDADDAVDEVESAEKTTGLSMAALQQHFIACRLASAKECVEGVKHFEGI